MNISEKIAHHVVTTELGMIDEWTINRAKDRILDSLGTIMIGRDAHGNDGAARVYAGSDALDEATVLGRGTRTSAAGAATINALMQRSWDFEACGAEDAQRRLHAAHVSGSTFPTALAVGERVGASGAELLRALILGDDIATRITVASGFNLALGTDNTGISNGFGCVTTAAALSGLNQEQLVDAFGLVLNQLSGTIENIFDGAMAFKLPQAMSARNAINSVDLAAAGFTGPKDPLGGRFGFFSIFGDKSDTSSLLEDLGSEFYADKVIKPWSCCRIVQGPVQAATVLRQKINLEEIHEVQIIASSGVLDGFTAVPFIHGESTPVNAIFSLAMCVALGFEYGEVRPELITNDVLNSTAVRALHQKIRLVQAPAQATPGPPAPIKIIVRMADGSELSETTAVALGDIYANPLSREQFLDKYHRNMSHGGVERSVADEVLRLVEDLESIRDLRQITDLLANARPQANDAHALQRTN